MPRLAPRPLPPVSARLLACALLATSFPAAAGALAAQTTATSARRAPADSGTFVIRHAADTVATEHFTRTATSLEGTLAIHDEGHTAQRYRAVVAPDATLPLVEVTVFGDADSGRVKGKVRQQTRIIFRDDSVAVDDVSGHGLETRVFGTSRGAVPYLNLSFALLEQAVRRERALRGKAGAEGVGVPFFNLGGGQTVSARLDPAAGDSLSLAIGKVEFRLRVDADGRVLGGRIPAQNVTVDRVGS